MQDSIKARWFEIQHRFRDQAIRAKSSAFGGDDYRTEECFNLVMDELFNLMKKDTNTIPLDDERKLQNYILTRMDWRIKDYYRKASKGCRYHEGHDSGNYHSEGKTSVVEIDHEAIPYREIEKGTRKQGNKESIEDYLKRGGKITYLPAGIEPPRPISKKGFPLPYMHHKFPSPESIAVGRERMRHRGAELTPRQFQVSKLRIEGYSLKEIADKLHISISAVKKLAYE